MAVRRRLSAAIGPPGTGPGQFCSSSQRACPPPQSPGFKRALQGSTHCGRRICIVWRPKAYATRVAKAWMKDSLLLFPTTDFAIFFGIVFIGNWLLAPVPKRWRVFILIASYVFYGWWDWRFVFLLAISTVCTVAGGRLVHKARDPAKRRAWMIATVAAELGSAWVGSSTRAG